MGNGPEWDEWEPEWGIDLYNETIVRFRKSIIFSAAFVAVAVAVALFQPALIKAIQAKFRATDHFLTLREDPRIRYEVQAERNAVILKGVLPSLTQNVEEILGAPFEKPVEVFVCASQESFNNYVYLSRNVRGAVFVADGGAKYTQQYGVAGMISDQERVAFLSGEIEYWFLSDDPRLAVRFILNQDVGRVWGWKV